MYRLSACNGAAFEPPCLYMAVDGARGLLLGNYVDATGADFDVLDGTITPDPPVGRVGTGTFTASIHPRRGGEAIAVSGTYRACVTRMPACQG